MRGRGEQQMRGEGGAADEGEGEQQMRGGGAADEGEQQMRGAADEGSSR